MSGNYADNSQPERATQIDKLPPPERILQDLDGHTNELDNILNRVIQINNQLSGPTPRGEDLAKLAGEPSGLFHMIMGKQDQQRNILRQIMVELDKVQQTLGM